METYAEYLEHYGVKGMKWGVRRDRSERKEFRKINRRVSAAEINLKNRARMEVQARKDLRKVKKEQRKAVTKSMRPSLSKKKKLARLDEATRAVSKAMKEYEFTKAELDRAERLYNSEAKKLNQHVDNMMKKYGKDSVTVRTVNVKAKSNLLFGEKYCKSVINTGVTFTNFPIFGKMWAGSYINGQDNRDRNELLEEAAKKRY